MEKAASALLDELVERFKADFGGDELAAESRAKELISSDLIRCASVRTKPSSSEDAVNAMPRRTVALEQERVRVDDDLEFTWHRPPLDEISRQVADKGTIRVFLNGCFDLMHVGHFNVIRQAKATFYQKGFKRVIMVAGIHSDAAISRQKSPPLQSDEERIALLQATKWVDEMVTDLPYVSMSCRMADRLQVSYICHGDDMPVVKGGSGMYSDAIDNERFQLLKRTEGVSTTQILERLLRESDNSSEQLGSALATTQRLQQFAAPADPWRRRKNLAEASQVVYVPGTFDLLHSGQASILEQAAQLGDYLLVGLHADETVRSQKGSRPALTMLERAMGILSMGVVDDVVLDAPWELTRELITTMNVSVVVNGRKAADETGRDDERSSKKPRIGKYEVARCLGILKEVHGTSSLTTSILRKRFLERRDQFLARNNSLFQKEMAYVEKKSFVAEA